LDPIKKLNALQNKHLEQVAEAKTIQMKILAIRICLQRKRSFLVVPLK